MGTDVWIFLNENNTTVRMCLYTGHSYESNVVRSAKRVAYFGQVLCSCIRKRTYFVCCAHNDTMMSCQYSVYVHTETNVKMQMLSSSKV